jgi:hypothetical protein
MSMKSNLGNLVRKGPFLNKTLRISRYLLPRLRRQDLQQQDPSHRSISLEHPIKAIPRYGYGRPPHPQLYQIVSRNKTEYRNTLENILSFKQYFIRIPGRNQGNLHEPEWVNPYFSALDAAALYSFLCINNPRKYYEIGSGNSTKFARRAIWDHRLRTEITSIDPQPRQEIDSICDTIIRQSLEDVDLTLFEELDAGDILFMDGSHCCFTNSDVTVCFLDVLPRLKAGVLVEFHDIFLPYDYPPEWEKRYYSEQYLLAAYILAQGRRFDIVLPIYFLSQEPDLYGVMNSLWEDRRMYRIYDDPKMQGCRKFGVSFWVRTV